MSTEVGNTASTAILGMETARPFAGDGTRSQDDGLGDPRGPSATAGGNDGAGSGAAELNVGVDRDAAAETGKKRKKAGSAEDGDEAGERGRRPCDMCRKRKIKCTPLEEDAHAAGPSTPRCRGCTYLDIPCTYLYVNKRPGRPAKKDLENGEVGGGSGSGGTKTGKGKEKRKRSGNTTVGTGQGSQASYPPYQPERSAQQPTSRTTHLSPTVISPHTDTHRPDKRQRTGSRQSAETPMGSRSTYEESLNWSLGLDVQGMGEYATPRDGQSSGGQAGEVMTGFTGFGTGMTPLAHDEGTLQPFVPDFSGFSGGKGDDAGADMRYGNQGSNLQSSYNLPTPAYHHPHAGPSMQGNEFYQSQTRPQGFPDHPVPVHQRPTSGGPSRQGQQHAFRQDPTNNDAATGKISPAPLPPCPQIEDVASWSTISFFISLHLRYQHPIMPIIHKPTFNNDLALRLDRQDEQFRAFLLSLVAYVICQVPRSKMIGYFSQQELEALQSRCRAASRTLQDRQRSCNTLTRICTHILDYFYSQTVGDTTAATMLLAQGVRLAFCLGLHEPTPVGANGEVVDHVALQLRRRIFFQLYNTDKTDASSGMQILMNDFEGVPPYPLCIDDELITTEGNLPQPANRPSYMTGFVANVQLMQILSECMRRHRTYQTSPVDTDVYAILMWIEKAQTRMRQIIQGLPDVLGPSPPQGTTLSDQSEVFATQRANLLITAVSAEFALLDLKAMADPSHDISSERELVGREMYSLLSSIPIEHLAANGESMRGKVLRIIIALLSNSASPEYWNQHVRDWWEIYSKVQFVQMIPMNVDSMLSNANGV